MWKGTQLTDYSGIVLFDPDALTQFYGRIRTGTNLFKRFTRTTDGDEILKLGIVVPILAIDDAGYTIIIRDAAEPSPIDPYVVVTNATYPFRVTREAVLADLAVFRDWEADLDWQRVPIPVGRYAVTIRGFRRIAKTRRKILDAGYEFALRRVRKLPPVSADTGANMRTLKLDDSAPRDSAARASATAVKTSA